MSAIDQDHILPGLSVDCVIFGFHANGLKVLLLKLKNMDLWALPGGFVGINEDVDQAAGRILTERTGLDKIYLQQFHFFGNTSRNHKGHAARLVRHGVIPGDLFDWFNQRFVTMGYYALVEYSRVKIPQPDYTSDSCEWYSFLQLPELMLDHKEIIETAHRTLKEHLRSRPVGLNLLPKQFTMPELQSMYETILYKRLDRRNFQRRMLNYDILIRTGKRRKGGSHKAPWLYEFDKKKYNKALTEGLNSE